MLGLLAVGIARNCADSKLAILKKVSGNAAASDASCAEHRDELLGHRDKVESSEIWAIRAGWRKIESRL